MVHELFLNLLKKKSLHYVRKLLALQSKQTFSEWKRVRHPYAYDNGNKYPNQYYILQVLQISISETAYHWSCGFILQICTYLTLTNLQIPLITSLKNLDKNSSKLGIHYNSFQLLHYTQYSCVTLYIHIYIKNQAMTMFF